MTSSAPRAVIAAHGEVAAGLLSAVAQVTGRADAFHALSNRDLCAADIERDLRALVTEAGVMAIFTDLPGGSCTLAARRVLRDHPDVVLVTGVNLAALLDFACNDAASPADAARQAADRGRAAVGATSGAPVAR